MKRRLIFFLSLAGLLPATSAFAAGLHTWSVITYANLALQEALGTKTEMGHCVMFTIVVLFLAVSGSIVGAKYRRKLAAGDIAPSPTFSLSNFYETAIGMVISLLNEIVGHGSEKYLTLVGSLAMTILFTNLAGLLPGSGLATSNLNTTAALALVVFFSYNYFGMKKHGVLKYLEHFMGPLDGVLKYVMAPIMVPIELISHLARPMSLSLRLFGNMFGDHTIFGVFMVGLGISWPLIFPMPFLMLGSLVCIVQALVFIMLTMVYLALATAGEH